MSDMQELQDQLNAARQQAASAEQRVAAIEREIAATARPRILEPELQQNQANIAAHDANLHNMIQAAENGDLGQLAGAYETAIESWKTARAFADRACADVARKRAQHSPMAERTRVLSERLPAAQKLAYVNESMSLEISSQYVTVGRELQPNPIHPDYSLFAWCHEAVAGQQQRRFILIRNLLGIENIPKVNPQQESDRDVVAFRSRRYY